MTIEELNSIGDPGSIESDHLKALWPDHNMIHIYCDKHLLVLLNRKLAESFALPSV